MKKYFSYSEMNQWDRDKSAYIRQYVDGVYDPPNQAMELGTIIHATIEDPKFPWLMAIQQKGLDVDIVSVRKAINKLMRKRGGEREFTMTAKTAFGTSLLAIFDGFQKSGRTLDEYKTSDHDSWNQYRVDTNDQLSFYAYIYHLRFHQFFQEMKLHAVNVKKGTVHTFKTTRGPKDIEYISDKIERICDEIHSAGLWEKRLSRKEREKEKQKESQPSLL